MIDEEKYKEILDNGLLLDHYFVLCNIKNGVKMTSSPRIKGFVNLLHKKGYLTDGELTEKAVDLIQNCSFFEPTPVDERKVDLGTWASQLHKKCENKMVSLTGKRQIRDKIDGTPYSFLPNPIDLSKVLMKVVTLYKLKDLDKIEKTIMSFIEERSRSGKWFPTLQYYIMKNNKSSMVTDMESLEESTEADQFKSTQKFV